MRMTKTFSVLGLAMMVGCAAQVDDREDAETEDAAYDDEDGAYDEEEIEGSTAALRKVTWTGPTSYQCTGTLGGTTCTCNPGQTDPWADDTCLWMNVECQTHGQEMICKFDGCSCHWD